MARSAHRGSTVRNVRSRSRASKACSKRSSDSSCSPGPRWTSAMGRVGPHDEGSAEFGRPVERCQPVPLCGGEPELTTTSAQLDLLTDDRVMLVGRRRHRTRRVVRAGIRGDAAGGALARGSRGC